MNEQAKPGVLAEFQSDFLMCWRQLPNKGFFFLLLAAWLMLFQFLGNSVFGYIHSPSLLQWMYNAYQSGGDYGDDAYGNLIPFLVVGLFWWKRKELLALPLKMWPPALGLVGLGLALHIASYVIQEPRLSIVAMFLGIYGLTGLAWGPAWLRHSFFPFFLFIFCVPMSTVLEPITFPLRFSFPRWWNGSHTISLELGCCEWVRNCLIRSARIDTMSRRRVAAFAVLRRFSCLPQFGASLCFALRGNDC